MNCPGRTNEGENVDLTCFHDRWHCVPAAARDKVHDTDRLGLCLAVCRLEVNLIILAGFDPMLLTVYCDLSLNVHHVDCNRPCLLGVVHRRVALLVQLCVRFNVFFCISFLIPYRWQNLCFKSMFVY